MASEFMFDRQFVFTPKDCGISLLIRNMSGTDQFYRFTQAAKCIRFSFLAMSETGPYKFKFWRIHTLLDQLPNSAGRSWTQQFSNFVIFELDSRKSDVK